MLKRTTNYTFQIYGSVYYSLKSAGKSDRFLSTQFTVNHKEVDSYYYSQSPVYLNAESGIVLLIVSKDGINYEEYVIHRVIRLRPNIYFNFISISAESKIVVHYAANNLKQQIMTKKYIYQPLVSHFHIKEILTCFYQVRKPNYVFPGESHEYYELTYIDHGSLDTQIEGMDYHLNKYDLMIYYPGQFHTQSTNANNNCSYLTITFSMDTQLPVPLNNRVFHTRKDIYQSLTKFMKAMKNEHDYLNDELSLLYLKEVLILLYQFDTKEDESSTTSPMQEHYESTLLNEILVFIHNNVYTTFTVEDLCVKFSISRSSLQNLFRTNINITPKQYISNVKLSQAKIMIQEHKRTISEISDILGFTSIHYFSRKFKMQYGMSPTDYAKSINL